MSKKHKKIKHFIFVCKGKDCKKAGAKEIEKAFEKSVKKRMLNKSAAIFTCDCTGRCKEAPVAVVNNHWIGDIDAGDTDDIIDSCF